MKTAQFGLVLALTLALLPPTADAQTSGNAHRHGMDHKSQTVQAPPGPTETGQAAFAVIQEAVILLEADPGTDWSKVNIDALRDHLVDMDNVTLRAEVESKDVEGGASFTVTGSDVVEDSIRRMVTAHAKAMDGTGGWRFKAEEAFDGAVLTVVSEAPADAVKIRALGFFGIMSRGMHHQMHHLMIAVGNDPHH